MREKIVLTAGLLAVSLVCGCSKKTDDAALVSKIQSQMFADDQLKNTTLHVESHAGVVALTGTVPSDSAHLEAYKIATETPGVAKVDDQITVVPVAAAAPVESAPVPAPATEEKPAHLTKKQRREAERKKREAEHREALAAARAKKQRAAVAANRDASQRSSDDDAVAQNVSAQDPVQDATPAAVAEPAATPAPAAAPQGPPPPPPTKHVEVAAGSTVTIRMIDGVDSSVNHSGQVFHASLEAPLVVGDDVIVRKGADVWVRLTDASSAGKFAGKSELHLELIRLEYNGHSYPLVSSTYSVAGNSRGKDSAEKIGGGAVVGAIIGAIAGGGKGAAIGAGVGGAGGTVYQGATHGKQVRVPAETKLDFQLDQPVSITVPANSGAN